MDDFEPMYDYDPETLARVACPILDAKGSISLEELFDALVSEGERFGQSVYTFRGALNLLCFSLSPCRSDFEPLADGRYAKDPHRWPHVVSEAFFKHYRHCPADTLTTEQARECIAHPAKAQDPWLGAAPTDKEEAEASGRVYLAPTHGLRLPDGPDDKIRAAASRAMARHVDWKLRNELKRRKRNVEAGITPVEEAQDFAEAAGHPLLFPEERARRLNRN